MSVSATLLLTTVIMVALGISALDTFYTAYILEALAITELYIHLDAKARRGLNIISIVLFVGFLFALVLQVLKILT